MELGGVTLSPDLYWEKKIGNSGIDCQMVRARDNTPIVFEQSGGPQGFDLVGTENTGTMTGATIKAIQALAEAQRTTYTLIYNSVSTTVRFRNEDQPVIEHAPIGPREVMTDTDVYNGIRIKLMEA